MPEDKFVGYFYMVLMERMWDIEGKDHRRHNLQLRQVAMSYQKI
jgi:phosphoenolpyruvate carboxylase